MLRICITGTIGSGKSSILSSLGSLLHCTTVQADQIAREIMEIDGPGYKSFCNRFAGKYLLQDGGLDRPGLKKAIAGNSLLKKEVENILHPLIRQQLNASVPAPVHTQEMVLYEIPLLFEAGWQDDFDLVIAVYVDSVTGRSRLMKRDNIDREYAENLLKLQMNSWQKSMQADMVVDNSCSFTYTLFQLLQLASYLRRRMCMKIENSVEKS